MQGGKLVRKVAGGKWARSARYKSLKLVRNGLQESDLTGIKNQDMLGSG